MTTVIVENQILHYGGDSRKRILRKMRWAFSSESLDVYRFSLPNEPSTDRSRTFAVNSYPTANVFIEASRTVEVTLIKGDVDDPDKAVAFIIPRFTVLPLQDNTTISDTWDTIKVSRLDGDIDTDTSDVDVHVAIGTDANAFALASGDYEAIAVEAEGGSNVVASITKVRFHLFDLHADNSTPEWAWTDGTHIWVENGNTIYVYNLDGTRDSTRDIDVSSISVIGIWGNDSSIWVLDDPSGDPSMSRYNKTNGEIFSGEFIDYASGNDVNASWNIGNDTHIFIANDTNVSTLYAYKMSDQTYDEDSNISITLHDDNDNIVGGYISDGVIYLLDVADDKFYAYSDPSISGTYTHSEDDDWDLDADNANPVGVAADADYVYVVNSTINAKAIYRYEKGVFGR